MRIRIGLIALSTVLASASLLAEPPASTFNISSPSNIPGATLQPGSYTISVVNKLSDRIILRVDSPAGDVHTTFIGIPNAHIARPAEAGAVAWTGSAHGSTYLKGWYFPKTSTVVEFVYPKADALAIAGANPSTVPAIDPASEGKVADSTLSQDDMQLLTLWLLSVQEVGNNQPPAVKAVRYQPAGATVQRPVVGALPHTASLLPLAWLLGLVSLLGAFVLRLVQRTSERVSSRSSV